MRARPLDRTTIILLGFSFAGLALIAALIWLGEQSRHPPDRNTVTSTPDDAPHNMTRSKAHPGARLTRDSATRQSAGHLADTSLQQPRSPHPEPTPVDAGHASGPPSDTTTASPYDNPVNQRVLGPKSWLAQPDDATSAAIQRQLSKDVANPTNYDVSSRDRRLAISRLQQAAAHCAQRYLSSDRRGHIIIRTTLVVSGGRAHLEEVTFDDILRLEQPRFRECIKRRASDIRFDAQRSGRLSIATAYRQQPQAN
jgi:hypothetical protein